MSFGKITITAEQAKELLLIGEDVQMPNNNLLLSRAISIILKYACEAETKERFIMSTEKQKIVNANNLFYCYRNAEYLTDEQLNKLLILGNSVRKTEQPSAEDIRALELLVASITLSKEEDTNSYLYRNYSEFVNKHYKQTQNLNFDFLHVACGIGGEAGEIIDALKKHAVYGKQLDVENVVEEIGDILFYIVALCNLIGTNLEAAIIANIAKLRKRYPEGAYSDQAAINRADKP